METLSISLSFGNLLLCNVFCGMQLARVRQIQNSSRKVVSKLVPTRVLVDQIWVCWWKDWRCLLASGSRSAQSGRLVAASVIEIHRKPTENIENTLDNTKTR